MQNNRPLKLMSGTSNPELAQEIANYLKMELTPVKIRRFADGEVYVRVEESIRGRECFFVQSTCNPVNENLMELLIAIDAMKRASAASVTAVIPYYGYARQDRKAAGREPITAKLVADLLVTAGADRYVLVDLHQLQITGFINSKKVDHLFAIKSHIEHFKKMNLSDLVIVSPDAGAAARARNLAKGLGNAPIAIIDKRRDSNSQNQSESLSIVGDVEGKTAIMVDDLVDTAGTLVKGARLLMEKGAKEVYACCTHPVLSGQAIQNLEDSPIIQLVATNSIPESPERSSNKIVRISLAPLLGEGIRRIYEDESVSKLFD